MPGAKTAAQLVRMVRDSVQHQQKEVFRDGFATDADQDGTSILFWINYAINELLPTGFCQSWFQFTTVLGQHEYTLDEGAHSIQQVLLNGLPLRATTLLGLDSTVPGWQDAATRQRGKPSEFYAYSDRLGLYPAPDARYTLRYLAESFPYDLEEPDDVPSRLPARFHPTLALRAAWWLCNMDAENETAAKRMPALEKAWLRDYADLQGIIQHRAADLDDQIQSGDYRHEFSWRT